LWRGRSANRAGNEPHIIGTILLTILDTPLDDIRVCRMRGRALEKSLGGLMITEDAESFRCPLDASERKPCDERAQLPRVTDAVGHTFEHPVLIQGVGVFLAPRKSGDGVGQRTLDSTDAWPSGLRLLGAGYGDKLSVVTGGSFLRLTDSVVGLNSALRSGLNHHAATLDRARDVWR